MTNPEKIPNIPLEIESLEPHVKQPFIEEVFAVKSKIKILMEKFGTPPDSPPVAIIDLDDQPMWSRTRTVAPTPSSAIIQLPITNNFHIKGTHMQIIQENQFDGRIRSDPHRHISDFLKISNLFQYGKIKRKRLTKGTIIQILYHGLEDPTHGILDTGGIFLYKTLNEAFKILEDKVLLKFDFLDDSQNPRTKTIVFAGASDINSNHAIFMDKFEALARKIDFEFLKIRKELKEMQDGHSDNHAS
ncbi:hypothetical protein Tco_0558144 [Tanacetum coccineum]